MIDWVGQLDDLESLLNSISAKDVLHNGVKGFEGIYWEGTERRA